MKLALRFAQKLPPTAERLESRPMPRGRAVLTVLALIALAMSSSGAVVGQAVPPSNDPSGDLLGTDPSGPDLLGVSARDGDDELVVALRFATAIADNGQFPPVHGFVDLDLDGINASGGQPSVDFLTPYESSLGSELHVTLNSYDPSAGTMELVESSSGTTVGQVPANLDDDLLEIVIGRNLLGDGPVRLAAVVGTPDEVTDAAPNGGFVSSSPASANVNLQSGRFALTVDWTDFSGNTGSGSLVSQSDDSALFWFFDESNWELLVKVLDGCGINGHFWVFSAATTNVAYSITVTDTSTGTSQVYSNELGQAAPAVSDTEAFATCN